MIAKSSIEACNQYNTTIDTQTLHYLLDCSHRYALHMAEITTEGSRELRQEITEGWLSGAAEANEAMKHIERIIDPTGKLTKSLRGEAI